MKRAAAVCLLSLGALAVTPAEAQEQAPQPPGPYVIDVRGSMGSLPEDVRLAPLLPAGTRIPTRGLGITIGGHVYPLSIGPARVGLGVGLLRMRAKTAAVTVAASESTGPGTTLPGVSSIVTAVLPEVSFNFGSASGWSHLSGGVGAARLRTTTSPFADARGAGEEGAVPTARLLENGTFRTIHMGGGARWFTRTRMAFAFDVRFHRVPPGASPAIGTAATFVIASVGVSLR